MALSLLLCLPVSIIRHVFIKRKIPERICYAVAAIHLLIGFLLFVLVIVFGKFRLDAFCLLVLPPYCSYTILSQSPSAGIQKRSIGEKAILAFGFFVLAIAAIILLSAIF